MIKCNQWFLFLFFVLLAPVINAQMPSFQKIFGDSITSDRGVATLLIDDQIVMLGNTTNPKERDLDIELVSLDMTGAIRWNKTFGTGRNDIVHKMILNTNDEIVIVGEIQNSSATSSEGFVLITDKNGEEVWFETYDDRNKNFFFNDIKETPTGDYIICGAATGNGFGNDYLFVMIDKDGEILWQKDFGNDLNEVGVAIYPLEDGSFFVAGDKQQSDQGPYGIEALGLDSLGNVKWQTDINDFPNGGCKHMIRNQDGQFMIVGEAVPPGQMAFDVILANINADGTLNSQIFVPATNNGDAGFAILELENLDEYVITGYGYNPETNDTDIFISQVNNRGEEIDRSYFKQPGNGIGYDLIATPEGGFIVTGAVFEGNDPQYFLALDYPLTTSTFDQEQINQPLLYPTLVEEHTQALTLSETIPNARVAIYNVMGVLVGTYESAFLNAIPIHHLESGVYYLQINSQRINFTEPILIK